jgi:glutamate N-acetyltransferase/amino-acid N-acetyltransferase
MCTSGIAYGSADMHSISIRVGGLLVFSEGEFRLNSSTEAALVAHMRSAMLYDPELPPASPSSRTDQLLSRTPPNYPPHSRCVEVDIELGMGEASASVFGVDLTHDYVSVNADYRS